MDMTPSRHEPNTQSANMPSNAPRSSSLLNSSAGSADHRQRVWLKLGARPHICPKCGSAATQRSQRHGILERITLGLLPVRPFRCMDCNKRFYGLLLNMHSSRSKIPSARQATHRTK